MRDGQLDHHILKQQGGESSLVCVFLVTHRTEVCVYSWEAVEFDGGRVYYVLGMHTVYESASIMDHCVC